MVCVLPVGGIFLAVICEYPLYGYAHALKYTYGLPDKVYGGLGAFVCIKMGKTKGGISVYGGKLIYPPHTLEPAYIEGVNYLL